MAIDDTQIIYAQLYKNDTIGADEFIDFLNELKNRIDKSSLSNTVFILDNASYHTGKKIKEFVEKNKLKFLFTIPYKSEYNPIELSFNLIKNHTYSTLNSSLGKLKKQIIDLIDSEEINKDIIKIYKITLERYLDFMQNGAKKYDLKKLDKIFLRKKRKYSLK